MRFFDCPCRSNRLIPGDSNRDLHILEVTKSQGAFAREMRVQVCRGVPW